jgi:molybdate transport system substrate-binding protein
MRALFLAIAMTVGSAPDTLAVGASYGLTVIAGARPGAERFALYVMSVPGQEILARNGFAAVGQP